MAFEIWNILSLSFTTFMLKSINSADEPNLILKKGDHMSDFPKSDPNKGIKVLYLINIIPKKQKIQNHLLIKSAPTIGIVVNPYMGDDVFIPFIENKQKVAIALIQTSNIEAKAIQELRLESGKML